MRTSSCSWARAWRRRTWPSRACGGGCPCTNTSSRAPGSHRDSHPHAAISCRGRGRRAARRARARRAASRRRSPWSARAAPVLEERRDSGASTTQVTGGHDPLAEWAIQWDQLRFGHVLRRGSTTNIYRGRWHGDVMIHTFDGSDASTERRFWALVSSLSMIRHENIVLFMGACMAPPHLAIVTGVRRGMSLHQHTSSRGSIPYPSRVNIARQVGAPPLSAAPI
ncbi:putative kinase suppressor of Ras (KSR) [Penaeus vannamei]|uniref:Putative kinase suppressor of Ras (KSR) n=1 Tax=Penaeus vannamei TaxID=6689 RepID=A0A423TIZ7_PENVA|nr:putative kinase suppressor of Ras (KSR) [Penaeus vannamei]